MFENFKKRLLGKIEKNSIKVDVNGEVVYLKKSGIPKEWHVIYPPINPETEKINWINLFFGGKANAVKYFLIGVIILLLTFGVYSLVQSYYSIFFNPKVQFCLQQAGINLSG